MELVGAGAARRRGGQRSVATSVGLLMVALAGALMMGGCGTVVTRRGSGTTPDAHLAAKIVAYSTSSDSVPNAPRQPLTISATCPAGEQMIGGGFAATDVFEYAAFITASYPSGPASWTVVGSSISRFTLGVTIYCLRAGFSLGVRVAQGGVDGASQGYAACPTGTALVSGGFRSTAPVDTSMPRDNGWAIASSDTTTRAYALCAAGHVRAAAPARVSFTLHATTNGFQPEAFHVACPVGQVVGGGFSSPFLALSSTANASDFSGWSLVAGGDGDGMLMA
ncbi:MAG TPA: hypothetical protein VKC57_03560, partial [Ktedonobacterales bacterium]|nr:hypothetical protein [Ktedonobacterales bacterium]